MELHQLRYFVAAAETLSVTRAAARCRVSQPALSQQIARLEASLGARVFDRLGRGIALTDAGRALLPRARRILAEVRDAEANVQREADEGAGGAAALSLGAIPTVAPYVLPGALKALRAGHRGCELMIRESFTQDLVALVLENQLDCAITSTPIDDDRLDVQALAHEELVVAMPATHAFAERGQINWADLRSEPVVTLDDMHCLGRQIEGFCSARSSASRIVCRTTQLATIFELVALGVGVSIVPEMAARHHGTRRWRYARLSQHKPIRQIAMVWRSDRERPRLSRRLAEIVKDGLGANGPSIAS
ncbi:MAG: LysR family transcriptional regulator [Phycisphaeraceae bacterium]|nr:LysR family transcriptional regulator [Phycisphaeraceae bacterium]